MISQVMMFKCFVNLSMCFIRNWWYSMNCKTIVYSLIKHARISLSAWKQKSLEKRGSLIFFNKSTKVISSNMLLVKYKVWNSEEIFTLGHSLLTWKQGAGQIFSLVTQISRLKKIKVDGEFLGPFAISWLCSFCLKVLNKVVRPPFVYCWDYIDPTVEMFCSCWYTTSFPLKRGCSGLGWLWILIVTPVLVQLFVMWFTTSAHVWGSLMFGGGWGQDLWDC